MKRIGMGLVGAGLVGPQHVEAVRRVGFVDVVAVAGSNERSATAKAEALGIPKAYGGYQQLIDDPDVEVVHNCTPNYLHLAVNSVVIEKKKHIVSDKPLAMNAAEAKHLLAAVTQAGVVHAVTFNYRGNPLVQQARAMVAAGKIGRLHFIHGHYLQDWLIKDTDFSWRIEPDKGGASSATGDIGSHWCDVVQHVSGLRIESVLADLTTVVKTRQKPRTARETFTEASASVPGDEGSRLAVPHRRVGARRPGVKGDHLRPASGEIRPRRVHRARGRAGIDRGRVDERGRLPEARDPRRSAGRRVVDIGGWMWRVIRWLRAEG